MAKLLALEWDAREARIVLARSRGHEVVVEDALAVDLSPRDDGSDVDVGQRLAAALSARGIARGDALVAVGRSSTELRQLSLPVAPLEELPELVRFQAMRQFASIDESWPVDFAVLASGAAEGIQVLAAAISPQRIEHIQETCQSGGMTAKRIVLRPFAVASLLKRRDASQSPGCLLVVDLLAEEADLTVLIDGDVAFVRTIRLPGTPQIEQQTPALMGEIRRTMLAAQNQLGGQRVEQVVLCGEESSYAPLMEQLADQFGLEVALFDPFEDFILEGELVSRRPQFSGRYAPLLGMLRDEVETEGQAIDFLHPRKKEEPLDLRRRLTTVSLAAVLVLLLVIVGFWWSLSSKDAEIESLQADSRNLDAKVKRALARQDDVEQVEKFLAGDVGWLDELSELSKRFPAAEKAILLQWQVGSQEQGGKMVLDGYAVSSATIEEIESGLRDERRQVAGSGGKEDDRRQTYRWQFKETVTVDGPSDKQRKPMSSAGRRSP